MHMHMHMYIPPDTDNICDVCDLCSVCPSGIGVGEAGCAKRAEIAEMARCLGGGWDS